jgi:hypothetical protein
MLTPQARVKYMENKRVNARMIQLMLKSALFQWMRAIGLGGGRGPAWPFGSHHVNGGVWKAWGIRMCHHLNPPYAWHTWGIILVNLWELTIDKHLWTSPAQIAL